MANSHVSDVTHNNTDALVYLDTSAEQHALFLQAFELAKIRIDLAITADQLLPGTDRFCIFSDLDETLLDNSEYNAWLVRRGRNFDERGSWGDFCKAKRSKATPGGKAFIDYVAALRDKRGNPIEIFYVTSRLNGDTNGGVRTATRETLQSIGYHLPDGSDDPTKTHLFMSGLAVPPAGGAKKYDHYAFVQTQRGRTPILWCGDNCSDFLPAYGNNVGYKERLTNAQAETRWGNSFIAFPNPVYGSFLITLRNASGQPYADDNRFTVTGYTQARPACTDVTTPKTRTLEVWDFDPDSE